MVFVWGSGWGPRRRGGPGWGPGPGWGRGGYGPGYGGPPPGYGRGYGGGGGGGCLRDLLLLNTGCCLAEALGCGVDAALLAPATLRSAARAGCGHEERHPRGRAARRLAAIVRVYQRDISPRRPPVCRFTPTCSQYALDALDGHGALRGSWLTVRRLVRCRPGAAGGPDPVPTPRAA